MAVAIQSKTYHKNTSSMPWISTLYPRQYMYSSSSSVSENKENIFKSISLRNFCYFKNMIKRWQFTTSRDRKSLNGRGFQ